MAKRKSIDSARLISVIEKHASTVTLDFLFDLLPVLGLRLRVQLAERGDEDG